MMTLVSKIALSAAVLAGSLAVAQPMPSSASPAHFIGIEHPLPHAPTIPADIGELETPDNPVREYVIEPGLRAWLERFGHISSMRLIARLARMAQVAPQYLWNGHRGPPGSEPVKKRSKNTFGQGR